LSKPFIIDEELSAFDLFDYHLSYKEFYLDFYNTYFDSNQIHPSFVGVSIPMGPQLFPSLYLSEYLKLRFPKIKIVCGGPALSLMDNTDVETFLRANNYIDVVVKFDGEKPLLELIQQNDTNEWLTTNIPGVAHLKDDVFVYNAPDAGLRMDDIPFANYDFTILDKLSNPDYGIIQARGCYWGKCSYCDFIELYKGSPKYRTKTVHHFLDEMEYLNKKYGAKTFSIITESIPPAFAKKMSLAILEKGLNIKWNSFAMVHDKFDSSTFKLMKESGCEFLVVGMESMNTRALKLVRKASDEYENIEFIDNAFKHQVDLKINIIPNLPSMTMKDALDSLDIIKKQIKKISSLAIFPFEVTKSSEIGREPTKFGLSVTYDSKHTGQAQYRNNHLQINDTAMSPHQLSSVIDAHEKVANTVNTKKYKTKIGKQNSTYFFHYDLLDQHEIDSNNYLIYNPLSRKSLVFSNYWKTILELSNKLFPITRTSFINKFSDLNKGQLIFDALYDNEIITEVENI
jgi:hypothetical protein